MLLSTSLEVLHDIGKRRKAICEYLLELKCII